jgi:hypothetical protein
MAVKSFIGLAPLDLLLTTFKPLGEVPQQCATYLKITLAPDFSRDMSGRLNGAT